VVGVQGMDVVKSKEMTVDFGAGNSLRYFQSSAGYSLTTQPLPKVCGISDAELATKANLSFAIRFQVKACQSRCSSSANPSFSIALIPQLPELPLPVLFRAMALKMQSLRDRQVNAIEKILNLNKEVDDTASSAQESTSNEIAHQSTTAILNENGEPVWKVLVFDNMGRDIISSVMRVNDLRSRGVTIHLNISAQRYPIPDVPVVYLVEPSPQNIQLITSDLAKGLYSPAYVNFLSSIPRPLLEDFAARIAETQTAEHLAQIYDQYLNFVVAEPDLFSLGMGKEAYWTLNSAKPSDEELDSSIDRIVSGLFSVSVTMGSIPIIRCPPGTAAQAIAAKLDRYCPSYCAVTEMNFDLRQEAQGSCLEFQR
jgi:hypothetical protein